MGAHLSATWDRAPAVTRSLTIIPLFLHVLGFAFGPQLQYFLDLSLIGVKGGRVWTIFTSMWWEPPGSLFGTLFTLLLAFWVLNGVPMLEQANGSGRLLLWTAASSVAVNVAFLLLALLLDLLWQASGQMSIWPMLPCHGLMPLAVFAMTARCLATPDSEVSLFGLPLKSKYYPFVLVCFFGLLSGPGVLQDVAGLVVGCFHEKPLRLRSLLPSDATVLRWEDKKLGPFGRRLFGGQWLKVGEAFGGSGLDGVDRGLPGGPGYTVMGRPRAQQGGGAPEPPRFQVFAGRGQRLGSG